MTKPITMSAGKGQIVVNVEDNEVNQLVELAQRVPGANKPWDEIAEPLVVLRLDWPSKEGEPNGRSAEYRARFDGIFVPAVVEAYNAVGVYVDANSPALETDKRNLRNAIIRVGARMAEAGDVDDKPTAKAYFLTQYASFKAARSKPAAGGSREVKAKPGEVIAAVGKETDAETILTGVKAFLTSARASMAQARIGSGTEVARLLGEIQTIVNTCVAMLDEVSDTEQTEQVAVGQ